LRLLNTHFIEGEPEKPKIEVQRLSC